jgi:hypothetical protein
MTKMKEGIRHLTELGKMGFNAEHKRRIIPEHKTGKDIIFDKIIIYPIENKRTKFGEGTFFHTPGLDTPPNLGNLIKYCDDNNLSLVIRGEPLQITLYQKEEEEQ